MVFVPLTADQTDKKSPVDDILMDTIRTDLDDLDSRIVAAAELGAVDFRLNGIICSGIDQFDCIHPITTACTVVRALVSADNSGVSGSFSVRINRNGVSGSTSTTVTLNASSGAYNSSANTISISCAIGDRVWCDLLSIPRGAPENLKVRLVLT